MQASATKKSAFKCPSFTVPSKSKDSSKDSNIEKEPVIIKPTSESEEDKTVTDIDSVGDKQSNEQVRKDPEGENLEVVKDVDDTTVKDVNPCGDAKPADVKKKVKKKPTFSVKQKEGENKNEETGDKPKKEKKPKTPKPVTENKEKPPRVPVSRPTLQKLPEKEPKEKKEKAPKPAPLPVRSLTDEEYEAIFSAAIETVLAINIEEWQPKETSPVVVKKKKYSVTVGRKPDPNKTEASQSSQESKTEEEKAENGDVAETDKVTREVCDIDYNSTADSDEEGGNVEERQDNVHEVDENNNAVDIDNEQDANQDNESVDMVQHENETTPEGSEVDYGQTPGPVIAPACASPPPKKKKIAGMGKKKKLEPKSLSFSDKEPKASEEGKASVNDNTEKPKAVGKVQKKDVSSTHEKKKTEKLGTSKKETAVTEKIKKLKQMVKELEEETKQPKKKVKADTTDNRKQMESKKEKRMAEEKKVPEKVKEKQQEKVTKPVKKQSKKVLMQKRKVENEGTWVQCCNSSCLKWRHLPDVSDPSEIPERWVCTMNTREEYNSCDKPEEKYDESEHIYTKFTEGSVVWAKISGWPWWPAMVEIDPDAETFFDTSDEHSMVPTHYHIVFFDDRVSRAWVKTDFIKLFTGSEEADDIRLQVDKKGASYKKEINRAKRNAMDALQYSLQERIELFGFATRYHGKWGNITDVYEFEDSKKSTKAEKKKKVTCRGDKKRSKTKKPSPTYLLDDEDIESILDNTESLLENVEEVLDSIDSSLDDSLEDSDYGPEEVIPKKKRKFESPKPETSSKPVKRSKAVKLDTDSENDCETEMTERNVGLVANDESENADEKTKGKLDSDIKMEKDVSKSTSAKIDTVEARPKEKIKFDPEIFTMEMDDGTQDDKIQKSHKSTKPKIEKESKNSKRKSKEFKAPPATKAKKALLKTTEERYMSKQGSNGDKKTKTNEEQVIKSDEENRIEKSDKRKDNKTEDKNEDKFMAETDLISMNQEELELGQNQNEETLELGQKEKCKKDCADKMSESGDELDLAPEVPDINSQEKTGKKEQEKVSHEDSDDDDFDLVEKSLYDNDPVLDKVHDMEVVNVTVYHGQDSDSDPFDMMMEE